MTFTSIPVTRLLPTQITSDDKYPLWQGFNHIVDEEEKLDSFPLSNYDRTSTKTEKKKHIAKSIFITLCHGMGGRFLSKNKDGWTEQTQRAVLHKIAQALRDTQKSPSSTRPSIEMIITSSDKEGTVSSCTTLYSEDISSPVQSLNNNNLESFRPHIIQTEIDNIDPILNVLPQITSDDKYPLWQGFIGNNHIVDEEEKLDSFPPTLEDDYNDDKGLDFSETSWELMPPLFVQEATRK
eukprot:CAMPEP_0202475876 /NCGR_PEP_ID=MMETSP1360-20130828/93131_1 /ASSEMBLY_ACC=CAM_ASM_000848 /TAXON_ID=515479 /ORGANISM="Licmophora paradoxa, Strain CCMP2313" /LENGTH=237 /DNA_ID=CAMNT_0049103057 /DNA_START=644 /DNA_END=1358 /DNA_ORIENTATION=+